MIKIPFPLTKEEARQIYDLLDKAVQKDPTDIWLRWLRDSFIP